MDRFKSDYHSVIVAFFASLFKKKMEKIEGVYVGQERQVRMYGSITDTTWDSVYDQIITVKLYEKDWYEFTKTVEPTTFDCPAKSLVRYGTYSSKDGFILKTSTKVTADGDNLSYEIEVNNSWTGSYEHYYFSGYK